MPPKKIDARQGPSVTELRRLIEEFLTINDMDNDGIYFGWLVAGDRNLVQRLRDGGDLTTTKMDDIIAFMQNPDKESRTKTSQGLVIRKTLQPLTIKPKEHL